MVPHHPQFPSTHWSLVAVAQDGDEAASGRALEDLCTRYWYPIYAYLRRSGHSPPDAEDVTQAFFHRIIRQEAFLEVDQTKGRLRSFLLGVLKRVLSDNKRHREALKRGGQARAVQFDENAAEHRYQKEPKHLRDPAALFDHAWAVELLTTATDKLKGSFEDGGNAEAFEHLREFLPLGDNRSPYREVAQRMDVSENVVRLQVHRMRSRYRILIEEAIAITVQDPAELADEINYMMTVSAS